MKSNEAKREIVMSTGYWDLTMKTMDKIVKKYRDNVKRNVIKRSYNAGKRAMANGQFRKKSLGSFQIGSFQKRIMKGYNTI